jgi:hypothetical protein
MTGPWQEIGELIDTLDAATTTGCRPWPGGLACAATTSLARRLGCAQAGPVADHGGSHLAPEAMAAYGESLAILERVVVAPAVGRFYPDRTRRSGSRLRDKDPVWAGHRAGRQPACLDTGVQSLREPPHGDAGRSRGHVVPGQPVAWLRVRSGASSAG